MVELAKSYKASIIANHQSVIPISPGDGIVVLDSKTESITLVRVVGVLSHDTYLIDQEVSLNTLQIIMTLPEYSLHN